MDKKQIEKNKLDLEYHKNIQILNGLLIFATTGLLGFIGSFIWIEEKTKLVIGVLISLLIIIIAYSSYNGVNRKLNRILIEMDKLK